MSRIINISICLSDLPKDKITKSEKNGKKYINLIVDERKEVDQYGQTHSVSVSQTKEEREAKTKKVYVGSGKEFVFKTNGDTATTAKPNASDFIKDDPSDDLPF